MWNLSTRRPRVRATTAASLVFAVTLSLPLAMTPAGAVPAGAVADTATDTMSVSGFVVAADGLLYRTTDPWWSGGRLNPVSEIAVAPPGASLSGVRQRDGKLALFFIGYHGGLVIGTTNPATVGLSLFHIGPGALAWPGGQVSAVTTSTGIHVFFPGRNGAVYAVSVDSVSFDSGVRLRPGPVPWQVSLPGLIPPSAAIAAGWDPSDVPGAVVAGADGGLYSVWLTGTSGTTVALSPPQTAPPGARVAMLSGQGPAQAFVAGNDGTLWQFAAGPKPDPWQPLALTAAASVSPGASLAATYFATGPQPVVWGPAAVFFVAADRAVKVVAKLGPRPEPWQPPVAVTLAGAAAPNGVLSVAAIEGDPMLYVAWCGNEPLWWWLRWRKPVPPPPPAPWLGTLNSIRATVAIRPGYHITTPALGF